MKWTKKVPKRSGWYWVKYTSKNGKAICPSLLNAYSTSTAFTCSTCYGDLFDQGGLCGSISHNDSLRFGDRIEQPE